MLESIQWRVNVPNSQGDKVMLDLLDYQRGSEMSSGRLLDVRRLLAIKGKTNHLCYTDKTQQTQKALVVICIRS
jgi:hypothetical protein